MAENRIEPVMLSASVRSGLLSYGYFPQLLSSQHNVSFVGYLGLFKTLSRNRLNSKDHLPSWFLTFFSFEGPLWPLIAASRAERSFSGSAYEGFLWLPFSALFETWNMKGINLTLLLDIYLEITWKHFLALVPECKLWRLISSSFLEPACKTSFTLWGYMQIVMLYLEMQSISPEHEVSGILLSLVIQNAVFFHCRYLQVFSILCVPLFTQHTEMRVWLLD